MIVRVTLIVTLLTMLGLPVLPSRAEDRPVPGGTTIETITEPVLRFEEVEIPSPATVQLIHGKVELYTRTGWVPLTLAVVLGDNSRLRIPAGATLHLVFSPKGSAQFQPAPKERLVALRVRGTVTPAPNNIGVGRDGR